MPNGRIEAKIGRTPCLSSVDLDPVGPPAAETLTVTMAEGVVVPSMVNEVGATEQLAPEGALQVKFRV